MPSLKITPFAVASILFMILALLVGIFRLMAMNSLFTGFLIELYPLHSIIMVFGFLAGIVMTERVGGIASLPGGRDFRLHAFMVPLTILGVLWVTLGYVMLQPALRYFGAFLLTAGCLMFLLTLRFLRSLTDYSLPFSFMILSVLALLGAAVLSGVTLPSGNLGFVMLLLAFPVLFILGERIDLAKFTATASSTRKFTLSLVLAVLTVALFATSALQIQLILTNVTFLLGSIFLFAVLLVALLTEIPNLRRLSKSPRALQRHVSLHVRVAYVWGLLGLFLAIVYGLSVYRLNLYDSFIHALSVGYVGTMILAHGPLILPAVMSKSFSEAKLSTAPLAMLSLSVALRTFGELAQGAFTSDLLRYVTSISGWLVLAAVLLFVKMMATGMRASG